jgi:hypothetical protein
VEATVTLSYLTTGFDWTASYVATLAPSGDRIDMRTWITLASTDETGFAEAATQTVAGRLEWERPDRDEDRESGGVYLRCWPAGTTSSASPPAPPPPPPPRQRRDMVEEFIGGGVGDEEAIMVTGLRVAVQEDLGDLKLYRIPEPVDVPSQSQKQVAMFERENVKVGFVYRATVPLDEDEDRLEISRVLTMDNRKRDGLGLPLPGGTFVLFAAGYSRPVLVGEGELLDKAIDENVEVELGEIEDIFARVEEVREEEDGEDAEITTYALIVTNPRSEPVTFEAEFENPDEDEAESYTFAFRGRGVTRRKGRYLWTARVPANGTVRFEYKVRESY